MQTRTADTASSIESFYSLKSKTAVIQFIDEHSFLIPLLLEAREEIAAFFPKSDVSLEITPIQRQKVITSYWLPFLQA